MGSAASDGSRDANKELVRRHFDEIWNQRRLDACEELMAEAYTENAPAPFSGTAPGAVHGPSAMRGTVAWLTSQFPDLSMQVEAVIAEGDLVAARVVSSGTFLGQVEGMPAPTGRAFSARQTHWFRVTNERLSEHWATRDDLTAMIQVGLISPPGPPLPSE